MIIQIIQRSYRGSTKLIPVGRPDFDREIVSHINSKKMLARYVRCFFFGRWSFPHDVLHTLPHVSILNWLWHHVAIDAWPIVKHVIMQFRFFGWANFWYYWAHLGQWIWNRANFNLRVAGRKFKPAFKTLYILAQRNQNWVDLKILLSNTQAIYT